MRQPFYIGTRGQIGNLHTFGGLSPRFIVDWPNYLTGLGYVTLSVDSFGPRGLKRCPNWVSKDKYVLIKDAYGGLEYLASLPFVDKERIGVMGFSSVPVYPLVLRGVFIVCP